MKRIDQTDAFFYTAFLQSLLNMICDINNIHAFPCFNLDHNHTFLKDENLSRTHQKGITGQTLCAMENHIIIIEDFEGNEME